MPVVNTIAGYSGAPEAQVNWLGPKVGGRWTLFCIHEVNRVNSGNGYAMTAA